MLSLGTPDPAGAVERMSEARSVVAAQFAANVLSIIPNKPSLLTVMRDAGLAGPVSE
jgi:hypothetical protein